MKIQKSFMNELPTLYLVATPIGNLDELTPRAIEILHEVDVIAAEDTRTSMKLLQHFDITTHLISHHNFNEKQSSKGIVNLLKQGKHVAIISDAGYPLISDPGLNVVALAIQEGFNVVPISGANAAINALVASGLSCQPYLFWGFLSSNTNEAMKELKQVQYYPCTLLFYEAPHRLLKTLRLMQEILGDRYLCVARELTKKHEEFIRGTASEILDNLQEVKGELVLVVEGYNKEDEKDVLLKDVHIKVEEYIALGMSTSIAIKTVAKDFGLSKNEVYQRYFNRS